MSARGELPDHALPSLPLRLYCPLTGSFTHPGVTRLRPSILSSFTPRIRIRYLTTFPDLATPSILPRPRPCRCQNIFWRCTQLLLKHCFMSPLLTTPTPSILACLPITNIKYRPQHHPLHHCFLPLVNVRPHCMISRFFEYPRICPLSPGPVPMPLVHISHHLSEEPQMQPLHLLGNLRQQNPGLQPQK